MRLVDWGDLEKEHSRVPELAGNRQSALTVGVFDGLHRGHRALIKKITQMAPKLVPAVVTFRENPKRLISSDHEQWRELINFEEKMDFLDTLGVALCVIIDFSEDFSRISGGAFVESLCRFLRPAYMAVGVNFHCGYRRDTDAGAFKALAENRGVRVEILDPVLEGGLPVSSSRIRQALKAGRRDEAALLLGRPPGTGPRGGA
ncbi:MAG: FAD synthetase family protein [Treponema sp.]|jgi:riboflavin kinase/FMN adenylyltransferase|nr:FAD synthetase family protein [Treponema sp.]